MKERSKRQSFLGSQSDRILGDCSVAIVGLGGGGSHIAQQLAHLGVANFLLIDPDRVEESNLNRLIGATAEDTAKRTQKTLVASRLICGINPLARTERFDGKWQEFHQFLHSASMDTMRECFLQTLILTLLFGIAHRDPRVEVVDFADPRLQHLLKATEARLRG